MHHSSTVVLKKTLKTKGFYLFWKAIASLKDLNKLVVDKTGYTMSIQSSHDVYDICLRLLLYEQLSHRTVVVQP